LTLFRIQCVHIDQRTQSKQFIWLGLGTGKLLIVQLETTAKLAIRIVCEAKWHQTQIQRLFKVPGKDLLASYDSSGQICKWDLNLTQYKRGKLVWEREAEYASYERVSLRICSWNVAAQSPLQFTSNIDAQRWLGVKRNEAESDDYTSSEDIILVSLQEIIDLNTVSLNAASQSQAALDQWIHFFVQNVIPQSYRVVHSSAMVGLGLLVFCRSSLKTHLSSVSDDSVKTGLGGLHGNKGGLIWRAFIFDCPVAFVAAHLAAGQTAINERNTDIATIMRTATLSKAVEGRRDPFAFPTGNEGSRLFDHCAVFVSGDLNYRIDLDRAACIEEIVREADLSKLREKDQLAGQMERKDLLWSYFREAKEISQCFPPTYKYDRGSVDTFDSSEKSRAPAWCDRILHYSKDYSSSIIQSNSYSSYPEIVLSDHKPISATFELKCRKINQQSLSNLLTQIN
jgi:hypothetical protein